MKTDPRDKLRDLLKDFTTAMLVSYGEPKGLRARPMALLEVEESCRVWFIASQESAKVHEIEKDTRVMIVCQNGQSCHLAINGVAHLEKDRERLERLWRDSFKVWFPEGKNDPNIILIAVQPLDAEFWDNRGGNGVKYLMESAKAYFSGEPPKIEEGEQHGHVVMVP